MIAIEFAYPKLLFLLLLMPLLLVYYYFRQRAAASVQVSTIQAVERMPVNYKQVLRHVLFGFKMLALVITSYSIHYTKLYEPP